MAEFFQATLAFPAVLFTFLLIVCVGYWLLTLFGAIDVDEDAGDLLGALGFGGVPLTIVLTLTIVVAWFLSLVGTVLLAGTTTGVRITFGVLVLLVAIVLALLVTRLLVTPLRKVFHSGPAASRADFIGRTCVIRTSTVATDFGQAEVHAEDGSSAVVQVRQTGTDDLRAGQTALIYDYDTDGEFFWVAPVETHLKD
ncbi:OB-fold-containig protein [Kibdelosporangium aridum]|uniref:OB-fold-containig protein n=1 Tax=Kibdelosporangium aridum TaxID=2030 RepID=UPI000524EFA1